MTRAPIAAGISIPALLVALQLPAASQGGSPPTVQFDVAPAPGSTVPYSVPFTWQGADLDGTVSLYRYAIDPPEFGEPYWSETSSTGRTLVFVTSILVPPIPPSGPITFTQPHTVVVKAVDNDGLESEPVSRAFFTSNIAPDAQIVSPVPSPTTFVSLPGTDVTITWQGSDSDGVFTNRPVRYKYLLMSNSSTDFPGGVAGAWADPNAFRDRYAPLFDGWETTSSDSTTARFTNLVPGARYLFCVVSFDEAGAYSARFGRAINMIQLRAGAATPTEAVTWGRLKRRYR